MTHGWHDTGRVYFNEEGYEMANDEMFCTIDILNAETAAYLAAILAPALNEYVEAKEVRISKIASNYFAGGKAGMDVVHTEIVKGKVRVRNVLLQKLTEAGAHHDQNTAP